LKLFQIPFIVKLFLHSMSMLVLVYIPNLFYHLTHFSCSMSVPNKCWCHWKKKKNTYFLFSLCVVGVIWEGDPLPVLSAISATQTHDLWLCVFSQLSSIKLRVGDRHFEFLLLFSCVGNRKCLLSLSSHWPCCSHSRDKMLLVRSKYTLS
jgi:hypothetical protein